MARDHARIYLSIWGDPDWTSLTSVQQLVYLALTSSDDLSYCGVAPLIPARYQHISADMTPRKFMAAIDGLEARSFVVTDRDTVEVLVRSYVRHDGLIKLPNVTKAMVTALRRVRSQKIAESVWAEIVRLYADEPDAKGWKGFAEAFPEGWENLKVNPSAKGSGKGSRKGTCARPRSTPRNRNHHCAGICPCALCWRRWASRITAQMGVGWKQVGRPRIWPRNRPCRPR